MGKFGKVTAGRIGCFKSDTICLTSIYIISDIASDRKRERRGEGGGHKTDTTPHSGAPYTHTCVDQQRADRFSL